MVMMTDVMSILVSTEKNNSTGGFTKIATVAMQALHPVSRIDSGGRNITALPNSLDFGDILKFGTLVQSRCQGYNQLAREWP